MKIPKILVCGDVHAHPDEENDRLTWLGKLAAEEQVDYLIQVGDFGDFPSLSSYDVGKASFEGRRYARDIKAVIDAQEKLFAPINKRKELRQVGKKRWHPKAIVIGGNHDQKRIERAANDVPYLDGTISIADCEYFKYWDQYVPFLNPINIGGFMFNHYWTAGRMDKPIGGVSPARALILKLHMSVVQGHMHIYDEHNEVLADGRRLNAIIAGCYFEHPVTYVTQKEQNQWWRGAIILRGVEDGTYEGINKIGIDEIKRSFGR